MNILQHSLTKGKSQALVCTPLIDASSEYSSHLFAVCHRDKGILQLGSGIHFLGEILKELSVNHISISLDQFLGDLTRPAHVPGRPDKGEPDPGTRQQRGADGTSHGHPLR